MSHHKVTHRTETRGLMHPVTSHIAELRDANGTVLANAIGISKDSAMDLLRERVGLMHSDQLEALKEGL